MNSAKRTPNSRSRASGTRVSQRPRGGNRWPSAPRRVQVPARPALPPRKVTPPSEEQKLRKPANTSVSTQTDSAPSPEPLKVPTREAFIEAGEKSALAGLKELLRYKLPELNGFHISQTDVKWTWMGAEYNPEVFSEPRIEFRLDPPMDVSSPLYLHNADVEQRYAKCTLTLRDLASVAESHPVTLTEKFADHLYDLIRNLSAVPKWGRRWLRSNAILATGAARNRMLRQVVWRGLSDLSSTAPPSTGDKYWVRGEIVGESGINRRSYSVVGERPANWFSGKVKYRRSGRITGELGPKDGLVYHCEELVDYLTRFCEFRTRSVSNLRTIQARSVMWCKEHGIRDEDASVFRAPSVIAAMRMAGGEFAAHAQANSTSFGASVTAANALAEGRFLPADDTTLYGLKSLAAAPYVGDIQIWHPTLNSYKFGLDAHVPSIAKYVGIPYIGFQRWFRLRQLLTPDVNIPLK